MTSINWLEIDLSGEAERLPYLEVELIDMSFPGWLDLGAEQEAGHGCYRVYLAQEGAWEARLQRLLDAAKALNLSALPANTIRDEDWAENWKQFYHPLEVGRALVICPSWENFQARPDQLVVTLDPGSAFGTGYHPTTQLCLELVEEVLRGRPADSLSLLDLGCGSGILAIAAWRLGVRKLWAIDEDPVAVKVACENFAVNAIPTNQEGGAVVSLANDPRSAGLSFDLVVANLIAATLIELAVNLAVATRPGGDLIVGGIIDTRHVEVRAALSQQGFSLVEERCKEDWYSMHFRLGP